MYFWLKRQELKIFGSSCNFFKTRSPWIIIKDPFTPQKGAPGTLVSKPWGKTLYKDPNFRTEVPKQLWTLIRLSWGSPVRVCTIKNISRWCHWPVQILDKLYNAVSNLPPPLENRPKPENLWLFGGKDAPLFCFCYLQAKKYLHSAIAICSQDFQGEWVHNNVYPHFYKGRQLCDFPIASGGE